MQTYPITWKRSTHGFNGYRGNIKLFWIQWNLLRAKDDPDGKNYVLGSIVPYIDRLYSDSEHELMTQAQIILENFINTLIGG